VYTDVCAKERIASGSAGESRIGGLVITYSKRVKGEGGPVTSMGRVGGAVVAGIGWKLGRGSLTATIAY
jgi:hypothetical protein